MSLAERPEGMSEENEGDRAQAGEGDEAAIPDLVVESSEPIPLVERQERLARIVSTRTLEGWTVVDKNEREIWAVLDLPGKPVNHVLHAIITLFSCGLWAIVWLILSLTQKKQERIRVSIDSYGNLMEERVVVA